MDTIRLESYPCPINNGDIRYSIFINGKNIIDMVKEIELPFAQNEGDPSKAGGYIGFNDRDLKHCFNSFVTDGKMYILGCGVCGISRCWPLIVQITTTANTIQWSDFVNPFHGPEYPEMIWDYTSLGPFLFDRKNYVSEFTRALEALGGEIIPGPRTWETYGIRQDFSAGN